MDAAWEINACMPIVRKRVEFEPITTRQKDRTICDDEVMLRRVVELGEGRRLY